MELRIEVDDIFINRLKERTGYNSAINLTRDAFTLLDWAIEESMHDRYILAGDNKDGGNLVRIVLESLETVRDRRNTPPRIA